MSCEYHSSLAVFYRIAVELNKDEVAKVRIDGDGITCVAKLMDTLGPNLKFLLRNLRYLACSNNHVA
jgi:hypothetical protein